LFGDEHREWCSYSTSDDADGKPGMLGHIHVRVIAGPAGRFVGVAAGAQVAHNVAVGIEGADGRNVLVRQASLPPGLSQQFAGSDTEGALCSFAAQIVGACRLSVMPPPIVDARD
jgi:hypothetical protein